MKGMMVWIGLYITSSAVARPYANKMASPMHIMPAIDT